MPVVTVWSVTPTTKRETQTATAAQTVFTLTTFMYVVDANLAVYINGVKQIRGSAYTETSTSVVTFASGLDAGDEVEFVNYY